MPLLQTFVASRAFLSMTVGHSERATMTPSNCPSNDRRTREYLQLLGQHERRLRGFILALVPNRADAEDIAQEVRIRLWEQFDSYDPAKDFGVWARAIARYQVLTHRTMQSRHGMVVSSELMEKIAEQVTAMSEELEAGQKALEDCFEKLPAAKRELLTRYYSGKWTTRELAAQLGRTFDATRQTILRTRLALRDCVEEALAQGGPPVNDPTANSNDPKRREVYELADALLAGTISADQSRRLAELVGADDESLAHYIRFMCDSATLGQWGLESETSDGELAADAVDGDRAPGTGPSSPAVDRQPASGLGFSHLRLSIFSPRFCQWHGFFLRDCRVAPRRDDWGRPGVAPGR